MTGRAAVIGGGLGGLATALRLRTAGWQVTVLEKNSQLGGRCGVIRSQGYTFDTGPTLLLMRDVLDELFASTGGVVSDYLDLIRVKPNYQVHFGDGSTLEFSSDLDHMEGELETMEPGAGRAFRRYLDDAGYKYRVARDRFVERNFPHWYNFVTPANLYYLLTTHTLRKLDRHAGRYFRDPRLIAAFTFQTMYLGLAPADAPSVYSLLPYTELEEGIWFPRGGLYRIVEALAQRACDAGVEIETNAEVRQIETEGRTARRLRLADGRTVHADLVVCNADLPYARAQLLPQPDGRPRVWRRLSHGSSAFLLYLGVDRRYEQLGHHTVLMSRDTRENFDAIFRRRELPRDPSLYICLANRTDPCLAPPGHEAMYVLVPVPHLSDGIDWSGQRAAYRDRVYDRLEAAGLEDLRRHVVFEQVYTPEDFAADFNLTHGSAFGLAHGFSQVGYMRPSNKAAGLDNVYFVGASTVPGGGIPMVIIGSRLTAERIAADGYHA